MNYGEVLKRAWEIIWKHKVLWIFGILAGCGQAGGSGGSNSGYRASGDEGNLSPQIESFFNQLSGMEITLIIVGMLIFVLLLVIVVVFLGTIGRIGLIRGTMQAEQGTERLSFGELFRGGMPYFWRVFGLNLLVGLIGFFVALAVAIPAAMLTMLTFGLVLLCLIPLLCVLVPLAWALGIVIEQANVALVVENIGIINALKRGWEVCKLHIGDMLVMGLILLLGINLLGGLVIGTPLAFVPAPAVFGLIASNGEMLENTLILSSLCLVAYLPVLIVLSGILRAFTSSAWTLTYLRLTKKGLPPPALQRPQTVEPLPDPLTGS